MPGLGELIVILVLLAVAALAVRSLWKSHKHGGCCGDCESCARRCGKPPETK